MAIPDQRRSSIPEDEHNELDIVGAPWMPLGLLQYDSHFFLSSSTLMMIVLTIMNALMLTQLNKRKKTKRAEILAPYATEEEPEGGLHAWVELGDRHPDFQYVI